MYVNLELSTEKKKEIHNKLNVMFEQALTDEMLQEQFEECYKGQIKGMITELCQSKDFRALLSSKVVPILMANLKGGIE